MATVTAQNGYALRWGPNGEAAPELSGDWVEVIRLTDTTFEATLASGFRELYTGRGFRSDHPIVTGYRAFKPNGQLALVATEPRGIPGDEAVNDISFFELSGSDTIRGADLGDKVYGLSGNDTVFGNGGDDLLDGGSGGDRLSGGAGDDRHAGGRGNDAIDGGPGQDLAIFSGPSSAYTIVKAGGTVRVTHLGNGPDGTDTLTGVERLHFSDKTVGVADLGPSDPLTGTSGPDELVGTAAGETMRGLGGADTISGGGGNDRILGGGGNDRLHGGGGDDRLEGGQGADALFGGTHRDTLLGGGGNDRLFGNGGNDVLSGATGRDELHGGAGRDALDGSGGNDILVGGAGGDVLTGGPGADVFLFNGTEDAIDRIIDFRPTDGDRIDVGEVLVGFMPGTSDPDGFIQLVENDQGTVLRVDPNGGGDGFVGLAVLQGVSSASLDDLIGGGNLVVDPSTSA